MLSELELRFSGNDQEKLCALGNICHSETPDKEIFSRVAKFYKFDGGILEADQKMYTSFHRVRGLGYMTVSEMLETVHENDLFDMSISRVFIQCVAQIENLPPQHQGAITCQ